MSGRRNRRCASLAAAAAAAAGVVATGTAARAAVVSITSAKDNTLYQNATGSISNGAGDSFFAGKTGLGVATRGLLAFCLLYTSPSPRDS